jgi:DNA-binding response OmpR family regulator
MSKVNETSVLIVDDNAALAENIAEALSFEGYQTAIATSAEEALPRALEGDLSIVVTDFRLPGIDGAELVGRVRGAREGVRFIVMSAHTDEFTQRRAEDAGATFFPKPVNLRALTDLLRIVLANASLGGC